MCVCVNMITGVCNWRAGVSQPSRASCTNFLSSCLSLCRVFLNIRQTKIYNSASRSRVVIECPYGSGFLCAGYHAFMPAASSLTSLWCARSQHNVRVILHCSCRSFYLLTSGAGVACRYCRPCSHQWSRCSLQILQAMQSPVEQV